MSDIDVKAIEAHFDKWRSERMPDKGISDAFEVYTIEEILKDLDLTDEEVEDGNFGGGGDGGVDGMYFFINRTLMREETEIPEPAISAELFIIQSKYKKSFEEDAVIKLSDFCKVCFNWKDPVSNCSYLSAEVKEAIIRFQDRYSKILQFAPVLAVRFYYATKTSFDPDPKILNRVELLKREIRSSISQADVSFEFWGCAKLLSSVRVAQKEEAVIETIRQFSTNDGSVVCLVRLNRFAEFLTDSGGRLKTAWLEPNVRDYQGAKNPVNKAIRATLQGSSGDEDFWWLNNGVTILADKCTLTGDRVSISRPEIVNGLQTSHEVFEEFREQKHNEDSRNILLRIIVTKNKNSRNAITKATNSQTAVSEVSLKATDRLHFDIEDLLSLYGLFYDRRKGEYKRLKKPISKIVSITSLAQAVLSVFLQRPGDARARPKAMLSNNQVYSQIFSERYPRKFYASCALLDKQIAIYLEKSELEREDRTRIRYYVTMLAACELLRTARPTIEAIESGVELFQKNIDPAVLDSCLKLVETEYRALGANDKVSKGSELTQKIQKHVNQKFPPPFELF